MASDVLTLRVKGPGAVEARRSRGHRADGPDLPHASDVFVFLPVLHATCSQLPPPTSQQQGAESCVLVTHVPKAQPQSYLLKQESCVLTTENRLRRTSLSQQAGGGH